MFLDRKMAMKNGWEIYDTRKDIIVTELSLENWNPNLTHQFYYV